VVVFDPETATEIIRHTHQRSGDVYRLLGYLSEEGRPVVVSGESSQELHAFDAETDATVFEECWPEGRGVWSLLAFDDAATGAPRVAVGYENGTIRVRCVARIGDDLVVYRVRNSVPSLVPKDRCCRLMARGAACNRELFTKPTATDLLTHLDRAPP
jgi:hypothetical protein